MLKVDFFELNAVEDAELSFAVIMAEYKGKWVFARHKERETWEIPGGHREQDEDINDTASRELFEETGAQGFSLTPVCIYSVNRGESESFGQLFYSKITHLDKLPNSEIGEIRLFEDLPQNLTYPLIQPFLYKRLIEWKGTELGKFNMDSLLDFANPYYEDKDIMHDISHINRVLVYVDRLLRAGSYDVDPDIIRYAAYFHGFIYDSEQSIIEWLKDQGFSNETVNRIIAAAWESQKDKAAQTLEGKILHDAHMIEGGKTYLIVKSLITGSIRGQTLEQTIQYIEDNILGKGLCYLTEAQAIYHQQQEFARAFICDLKEGLA